MRKALALSVDREKILDSDEKDILPAYGIIPPAVTLLGRSYRELVSDKQYEFYDVSEAERCFRIAKAELQTETFDDAKILVCTGMVNADYLHRISQNWQEIFGFYIGIEEVTPAEFNRCIADGDYSIALYPLKGSYNSGLSVIEQFNKNNFLGYSADNKDLTGEVRRCADISELVDCYCNQESTILDGYGFVPLFYKNSYFVTNDDNEDIIYDAFTGAVDFRIAKNYS